MNLGEMKRMLEENGFNLWGVTGDSDVAEVAEKDNFTDEEFDKACEDLGLDDCGEESSDEDDFFQRLNQV